MKVDCHFVKQTLQVGIINLRHIRTEDHLTDLFTKALSDDICNKLDTSDIHAPPKGECCR